MVYELCTDNSPPYDDMSSAEAEAARNANRGSAMGKLSSRRGDTAAHPLVLLDRAPPATINRPRHWAARRAWALGLGVSMKEVGQAETKLFNDQRAAKLAAASHSKAMVPFVAERVPPPPGGGTEAPEGGFPARDTMLVRPHSEEGASAESGGTSSLTEEDIELKMAEQAGNKSSNYSDIWLKFIEFTRSDFFQRRLKAGDIGQVVATDQDGTKRQLPVFSLIVLRAYAAWLLMPEQGKGRRTLLQIRYGVNDGYERLSPSQGRPWKEGKETGRRLFKKEEESYATNRIKYDRERNIVRSQGGAATFSERGASWLMDQAEKFESQLTAASSTTGEPVQVHERHRKTMLKIFATAMMLLTMLIFMLRSCSAVFSEDDISWGEDGSMTLMIGYWKQTSNAPSVLTKEPRTLPPGDGTQHPRNRYLRRMKKLHELGGLPRLVQTAAPKAANRKGEAKRLKKKQRVTVAISDSAGKKSKEVSESPDQMKQSEKETSKQIDAMTQSVFGTDNRKLFSDVEGKSMTSQTYRKTGASAALKAGAAEIAVTTWGMWKTIPADSYVNPRYVVSAFSLKLFDFLCR